MSLSEDDRMVRLRAGEYGRNGGWTIEEADQRLAVLTDPRSEDMFWVSYHFEIVATYPTRRESMLKEEFWARSESMGLIWRSREFGEVAENAFPALSPFTSDGRLIMRGILFGP